MVKMPFSQIDLTLIVLLLLIILVMFSFADIFRKRRLFTIYKPIVKTELFCKRCDIKIIRDFKEGDYIFKVTDERCKKCGEPMIILAIYDVSPTKTS